ncbi:MAG: hypothetical protein HY869_18530 [Chloroflexi bacterium]|nr:hypothetical protein [Chloroflexota bacterium]
MIGFDQIALDVGMQWSLGVGMFLRFLEDIRGAGSTQKITDQHAPCAVDERIDRQRILALELDRANGTNGAARAQVAVVEPERFDGRAKACLRLHV